MMFYYKSEAKVAKKTVKVNGSVPRALSQENEEEDEKDNNMTIDDIFSNAKVSFLPPLNPKVATAAAVSNTAAQSVVQSLDNTSKQDEVKGKKSTFETDSRMEIEKFEEDALPAKGCQKTVTLRIHSQLPKELHFAKKTLFRCFRTNKLKNFAKRLVSISNVPSRNKTHIPLAAKALKAVEKSPAEIAAIEQLNELANTEFAEFFGLKQYKKDAEDIEYDRGRVKKIKKRVLAVKPDFQQLYESTRRK